MNGMDKVPASADFETDERFCFVVPFLSYGPDSAQVPVWMTLERIPI